MERVSELLLQGDTNPVAAALTPGLAPAAPNPRALLPLPCYFFDFIIGTSTGGLIAVMLGHLRMSIDECIVEYWKLSNYVFRPPRHIRLYDARKLETAIKSVVRRYCRCHPDTQRCDGGNELLRQFDYIEPTQEGVESCYQNWTCRVGLVSQRKGSTKETYLWRSYNHNRRFRVPTNPLELNPRDLDGSGIKIWEACRATSAAPFYFSRPKIGHHKHMDGGVGDNNPCNIAYNEALYMSMPNRGNPDNTNRGDVALLLSVGTGKTGAETRFGQHGLGLFTWMRRQITETQTPHENTQEVARRAHTEYFRFSVPPRAGEGGHAGLSKIKLGECKRESIAPWWRSLPLMARLFPPQQRPDPPGWYGALRDEAREGRGRGTRGGYKPDKYRYPTFEDIFERTEEYCHDGLYDREHHPAATTASAIDRCATALVEYARLRHANDPERWKCFVSHPHPDHPMYIDSDLRPRPFNNGV
ncbi:hypothetical protein, variant [Magnaporthiopsis poae ATCC 64411]|nr:hypothetical protein, variant [Magnaporthiopsis poae ATCC 64411]